jgi:hypothetical protein
MTCKGACILQNSFPENRIVATWENGPPLSKKVVEIAFRRIPYRSHYVYEYHCRGINVSSYSRSEIKFDRKMVFNPWDHLIEVVNTAK